MIIARSYTVSIRTRHFCRVMPLEKELRELFVRVSIRTRHFCRVMQGDLLGDVLAGFVSIRTRHFCRVMHVTDINHYHHHSFQSAPGISAG